MLREIAAYAKLNPYANIHPVEKLLLCILPIVIIGFAQSWSIVILNIICFLSMHYIAHTPYPKVVKFVWNILLFYLFSCIILIFTKGLYFSILVILKGLSASLCLALFVFTTPLDYILHYFSKFESIRDVCDICKSVERFFLLLEDEGNTIVCAMKSRGGFRGIKGKVQDGTRVFSLLFYNALQRWQITQDVLDSRCYRGKLYYGEPTYTFDSLRCIYISVYNMVFIVLTIYMIYYNY